MKPTCEQLFNDEFPVVDRESDDSWRHGCHITEVYHRKDDNTFWRASYPRSTDGESNGLREGTADIVQVFPREKVVTVYE